MSGWPASTPAAAKESVQQGPAPSRRIGERMSTARQSLLCCGCRNALERQAISARSQTILLAGMRWPRAEEPRLAIGHCRVSPRRLRRPAPREGRILQGALHPVDHNGRRGWEGSASKGAALAREAPCKMQGRRLRARQPISSGCAAPGINASQLFTWQADYRFAQLGLATWARRGRVQWLLPRARSPTPSCRP